MPELPEVEVTKRALAPHIVGNTIEKIIIRDDRLRWPINYHLLKKLENKKVISLSRRGKYIFINSEAGTAMIHLGMSGSLGVLDQNTIPKKHDHFDLQLENQKIVRFNDPRRFGCFEWAGKNPENHKLISHLGLEPLEQEFTGDYLYQVSRNRNTSIKALIMNASIVVGVGNIYANESLFISGIHPKRMAKNIAKTRYKTLSESIQKILKQSIKQGGTTLRDFSFTYQEEKIGYFKQNLFTYDRENKKCKQCDGVIKRIVQLGRSTFYCVTCQH
tara:strand:+ start:676 stop:1497 length:822 start_codon:yes stop_codon:yes gene_type:complete